MDVTPYVPEGRQIIEGYGDRRFRVGGEVYEGSVLVFPEQTVAWPVTAFDELTLEQLQPVRDAAGSVDLLLIGCGERTELVTRKLYEPLRAEGIVIEAMATGPACRTYNVLLAEERKVAAALIAV
jgi:uncharacterized protein